MKSWKICSIAVLGFVLMGCQNMASRQDVTHSTATGPGSIRFEGGTYMQREPLQMQRAEAPAPEPRPAPEVSAFEAPECVIYFDFDRSNIRSDQRGTLNTCARYYGQRENRLLIVGHADERGSDDYNMALGHRRAMSVMQFLVEAGIPQGRLQVESRGENDPAVEGRSEAAWARNRRVEFVTR